MRGGSFRRAARLRGAAAWRRGFNARGLLKSMRRGCGAAVRPSRGDCGAVIASRGFNARGGLKSMRRAVAARRFIPSRGAMARRGSFFRVSSTSLPAHKSRLMRRIDRRRSFQVGKPAGKFGARTAELGLSPKPASSESELIRNCGRQSGGKPRGFADTVYDTSEHV